MSKIFEGIKVLIISKLLGFTAISAKIIKTKIEQNGGKADLMPSDSFKDVNDYTYIIAPGNITEDHVKKLLNLNDIEILTILSPE